MQRRLRDASVSWRMTLSVGLVGKPFVARVQGDHLFPSGQASIRKSGRGSFASRPGCESKSL